jgi:hypothetical protein
MHQITFHTIGLGDVEDPEIYAAEPIFAWQKTEKGQWVMAHCPDPLYRIAPDSSNWGHRVILYGNVDDKFAV